VRVAVPAALTQVPVDGAGGAGTEVDGPGLAAFAGDAGELVLKVVEGDAAPL
jgi:hypothetical protein